MRESRIDDLQSLRGIAAFTVMIAHSVGYYEAPSWFISAAWIFNARGAVVVFFVLSGYVLTRSLRNSAFDQDAIVRFYVRRLFRLYPAIWVASTLGLGYLFALHWRIPVDHGGPGILRAFRPDRFDLVHIAASYAGMLAFILPPLWSIFVELVASVWIPGIAFLVFHRPRWLPGLLALSILVSFTIGERTYYHIGLYFMDFVVGAGLALPGLAGTIFGRAPAKLVFATGLAIMASTPFLPTDYWSPFAMSVETVAAVLAIGALVGADGRTSLLKPRFLLFIGDISYSVYLLQDVVLCTLAKMFALAGLGGDRIEISLLLVGATCVVTVPLAWASYVFVETPGIQLGKAVLSGWPKLSSLKA
jgi:peptidoglycan/LPS O-acetylase OafA/YrhL